MNIYFIHNCLSTSNKTTIMLFNILYTLNSFITNIYKYYLELHKDTDTLLNSTLKFSFKILKFNNLKKRIEQYINIYIVYI